MKLELPETGHMETLAAVVLGALLATVSGVIANQMEAHFRRRERERSAALLFGEVFSALKVIMEGADRTRAVGRPYGPITQRMLHAARRELDIYERNREALMDIRDPRLRADLHNLAVRLAMPIDGILDSMRAASDGEDATRDQAFSFVMDLLGRIRPLTERLGPIAGLKFEHFDEAARFNVGRLATGGPPQDRPPG